FSFGIPMAFAAVQGTVPPLAGWLLIGNAFWVLAYDTEYAMVARDDDRRIGVRTSAITRGPHDVTAVMAFYALYLASWGAIGASLGLGWPYAAGLAAAAALAIWHWTLIRTRTREGCFRSSRLTHWVGCAVFAGVVAASR